MQQIVWLLMGVIVIANNMKGKEYLNNKRPIVYTWTRAGKHLYVGIGLCGIGRIFGCHPHIRPDNVKEDDIISWTFYDSPEEAKRIERKLIRQHQPAYNKAFLRG